ncbi:MAG: ATP phosphoribosyltransferase [Candidatus Firestonebacteria bacterium RIFOXYC2_FULL_39_67]|nr:MAG: ATP phosphoribosyltransferase [Candidatus Firestonebacteria bacterium RIFOXYD2_FULL_39_29]OGF53327.1 MAG: ATP phosphoribosyltransferase [Candidatus Firestonebacteria bacterium RIFOXYC2_FULL_39_67]OGF55148.1 MAG: ATP phosphoribosyltransferase [Candidatus Firestonebacteria bacterium RifOxyC12_full_39_7]
MELKIGLPAGSLQESTIKMFKKAGWNISLGSRSYVPKIDDPELVARFIRAQEIPRYVESGKLDFGLTGADWVAENNADVVEVSKLIYAKRGRTSVKWVIAVPNDSKINSVKDLKGKRIATELVNVTGKYLKANGVKAEVEFSWGATEAKPPELVDAVVELTETGSSLRANNLRIIGTIMESATVIIANKEAFKKKDVRKKIEAIAMLLQGALEAETKVGLKMNLPKSKLEKITSELPALKKPTISALSDPGWVAIEVIIDESIVRSIIPMLKEHGAEGIIEYPLNKVVY